MSKARLVITAVVLEGRSQAEVARAYEVSQPWVSRLAARYRAVGEAAFEPRSRRPRSSPNATPQAVVERINRSGAGLVFIGLGCPKQDLFAHEHRESLNAIQVCVGAAFDFHAGVKKMAPPWMQRRGG